MEDKKQIVLKEGKKSKKKYIVLAVVIILTASLGFIFFGRGEKVTASVVNVKELNLEAMDYSGLRVDKVNVEYVEDGEYVGVSLKDLSNYKLVYFKYEGKPLLVYIDNKGNIITSIAMCEPCRNDEAFFIQDNILVCGKCWTRWKLGTHQGISGGCKDYPPDIIDNIVRDGNVLVRKQELIDWRPRV